MTLFYTLDTCTILSIDCEDFASTEEEARSWSTDVLTIRVLALWQKGNPLPFRHFTPVLTLPRCSEGRCGDFIRSANSGRRCEDRVDDGHDSQTGR